ncbi:MAG TPA: DUF222 domain-containing protein, partial [Acidimicrobiales bacterium]|nr:DUF222 domain-containing protein [Acidimicrobiales bacterium]
MAMAATLEAPTVGALDRLDQALEIVRAVVAEVDPDTVTGDDASLILERLVKIDRAVAAGRLGFARRSAQCMTWRQEGHRSAEDWLAQKTKSSVAEACAALKTAKALPDLPSTLDALRQGTLSLPQVREIATAATADPSSEKELIEAAGYLTLKGLQHRAGLVRAAAVDEAKRVAGLHRGRLFRNWLDPEGGFNLRARLTPDDGAQVLAMVRMRAEFVADEARVAGLAPESQAAYEADALVALVTGDYRLATFQGQVGGRQRSANVVYHVNLEA